MRGTELLWLLRSIIRMPTWQVTPASLRLLRSRARASRSGLEKIKALAKYDLVALVAGLAEAADLSQRKSLLIFRSGLVSF
jgi:hypothetical protein